uniref:hypothetical chloroplast RF20 n=1 Tax=Streptosarcina costaricana TaxID=2058783 RepID=UPI00286BB537|nr:hypothetical chloroplast RF20 [Streptosarcina costaricana]YP_010933551.1 hypothetical chloroplast RF20 [Streptosarcina costaricana]WKT08974.1 hypothetical chloroplast RF20 [Streptosarcina costaricana]WKT08975.1 hypothetical chloroplast RF20 [Streptosarcina costaricana]
MMRACRSSLKLPVRIGAFLTGFFQATALSTVVGQIGDWDVLISGALVAFPELLGALVYLSHKGTEVKTSFKPHDSPSNRTIVAPYTQALNSFKVGLV